MERSSLAGRSENLRRATAAPYEQEFLRNDSSHWWASISAKQLDEEEAAAYVTDITERKHAEQALRESEARFRAISEASPASPGRSMLMVMLFISISAIWIWSG